MPAIAAERDARRSTTPSSPIVAVVTPRRPTAWGALARELAAVFLLLVVVLVAGPSRPGEGPASAPWDYQR